MHKVDFILNKDLQTFVNCIMSSASDVVGSHTNIPLYADGYPGIMFQQSEQGCYLLPRNKKLSELFLYGQTLKPVALDFEGPYRFVVLQLYPFVSKYLLDIDPKRLNDDCYDLLSNKSIGVEVFRKQLCNAENLSQQVELLAELLQQLIRVNKVTADDKIQQAIAIILEHNGQIKMQTVLQQLYITERSFERHFMAQVGLTPKQFAKIIQFQCSLHKLTTANYAKLVEVGIDSGFADQSHFIRVFKKYTGQTPGHFLDSVKASH